MADRSRDGLSFVLSDRALALSQRELDEALEAELVDLGDAERGSFVSSLGQIARTVPSALPSVAQGAQTGAVAGPWGALAGAAVGGVSHYASGGAKAPARAAVARSATPAAAAPAVQATPPAVAPAAPIAPIAPVAVPPASVAPTAPLTTSGSSAAARLLRLLQDPRFLQACAALVPGQLGTREIQVNGVAAPPAAFMNACATLALEAAQQAPAPDAPVDAYLRGPDGQLVVDVASPTARARALLERLEGAAPAIASTDPRAGLAPTVPAAASSPGSAEAWLLDSGMAELVSP